MNDQGPAAIITGASRGIGAAVARELARRGYRVGLTARSLADLNDVAASIRAAGGFAVVAAADAADPASTRPAFARLIEQLGPIDVLVANAGVGLSFSATNLDADHFETMVRVNLISVAYVLEAVLPAMLARGSGRIVGISSLAAYRGLPGSAGYSASKAGLTSLLEGLSAEVKRKGIGVTIVHPGFIRTAMTAGASRPQPFLMDVEKAAAIIVRGIVAGRRRVDFPWPMVGLLRLVRLMPGWLYDRIGDRIVNGAARDQ